jgi:hypothetical protein
MRVLVLCGVSCYRYMRGPPPLLIQRKSAAQTRLHPRCTPSPPKKGPHPAAADTHVVEPVEAPVEERDGKDGGKQHLGAAHHLGVVAGECVLFFVA